MRDYVSTITFHAAGLRKKAVRNDTQNLFRALERAWPTEKRGHGEFQLVPGRQEGVAELREAAADFIDAEPENGIFRIFSHLHTAAEKQAHANAIRTGTERAMEPELMAIANVFHVQILVRYETSTQAERYKRPGRSDTTVVKLQADTRVRYAALV